MDDRAQISAELIVIIAALLAVAFVFINTLNSNVKHAATKLSEKADKVLASIDNITSGE
ncbi:MAG: class III signal peptide-containing protein [archaeon]